MIPCLINEIFKDGVKTNITEKLLSTKRKNNNYKKIKEGKYKFLSSTFFQKP